MKDRGVRNKSLDLAKVNKNIGLNAHLGKSFIAHTNVRWENLLFFVYERRY
jgi:hypothetical protein